MKWLHRILHHVGHYVQKPWYPALTAFLAFIDTFIFIVPTDGLLISSALAAPSHVWRLAIWTAAGSTLGSVALAVLIQHGAHFADLSGPAWATTWFEHYGVWALFAIAALPIVHHPVLILAILAGVALHQIALAMLAGRAVKFGTYVWLGKHAPKVLFKLKFIRKEVAEAEAELDTPHVEPLDTAPGRGKIK